MEPVRDGVWNLVHHCAEVKKGDSVLILNEHGKIDPEVAALIAEAVKAAGCSCWTTPRSEKRPEPTASRTSTEQAAR